MSLGHMLRGLLLQILSAILQIKHFLSYAKAST